MLTSGAGRRRALLLATRLSSAEKSGPSDHSCTGLLWQPAPALIIELHFEERCIRPELPCKGGKHWQAVPCRLLPQLLPCCLPDGVPPATADLTPQDDTPMFQSAGHQQGYNRHPTQAMRSIARGQRSALKQCFKGTTITQAIGYGP